MFDVGVLVREHRHDGRFGVQLLNDTLMIIFEDYFKTEMSKKKVSVSLFSTWIVPNVLAQVVQGYLEYLRVGRVHAQQLDQFPKINTQYDYINDVLWSRIQQEQTKKIDR